MPEPNLTNALSISCVENYFLTWASALFDVRMLYGKSYVPMRQVLTDFCEANAQFERYGKPERLQDVAEQRGLTTHVLSRELPATIDKNELLLVRVNLRFFKNAKQLPWRDDHYIWLYGKCSKKFAYANNYPLSQGELCENELRDVFGGSVLRFTYRGGLCADSLQAAVQQDIGFLTGQECTFCGADTTNLTALRNALGILKISRKRLLAWLEYLAENNYIDLDARLKQEVLRQIHAIESLYLQVELQAVRKRKDKAANEAALAKIWEGEQTIWKKMQLLQQ